MSNIKNSHVQGLGGLNKKFCVKMTNNVQETIT